MFSFRLFPAKWKQIPPFCHLLFSMEMMQPIRTRALSHARGLSMCTHLTAVEPTCQQDPMKLESFKKQTQIFRKKKNCTTIKHRISVSLWSFTRFNYQRAKCFKGRDIPWRMVLKIGMRKWVKVACTFLRLVTQCIPNQFFFFTTPNFNWTALLGSFILR